MNNSELEKEKKSRRRILSPSFKEGAIKEKKEELKLNLIEKIEDEENSDNKSPQIKSKELKKIENEDSKINGFKIKDSDKNYLKVNVKPDGHIKSIGSCSQAGKNEDGFTKINQDSFLVIQNEYKLPDFNIFSVLDGHGEYGHLVSRFVTKYLATFFRKNKKMNVLKSEDEVYSRIKKNDYDILKRVFKHAEKNIIKSNIDAQLSGTTCVIVFQIGDKIICANIGDSRAILVKGEKYQNIIPLSIDQKPNDPEEKKRIESKDGVVAQHEEDGEKAGPFRVWAKGQAYPGIAMSRSIGDYIASSLGVIPEPICIEETIDKDTKFIIVASDGIWEFLDNKRIVQIVLPFYKNNEPNDACKALIKEATEWWNKEDIIVDDITVIVVFF